MANLQKSLFYFILVFFFVGCSTLPKQLTNMPNLDLQRFMGKWYVMAGRFTSFETGAHNGVETYTYNEKKNRIDIDFSYNQDGFNGKLKSIGQKGWVEDPVKKSYWKISPFWPLKFDYLVLLVDEEYSWTAIGVPSQNYLWIMARDHKISPQKIQEILQQVAALGYRIDEIQYVPHRWP